MEYKLAGDLLQHSLQDNPSDVYYSDGPEIRSGNMAAGSNCVIDKVKNTNAYKNLVNELASNAKGSGSETFAYDGSISFGKNDDYDLFGGIHAANTKIYGQLNNG